MPPPTGCSPSYWPKADPAVEHVAEPIDRLPKFVVSNTLETAPWGDGEIEILRGDGAEATRALKERFDHIIVWGSLTLADALFEAGLVDELRLRVVPVLIGAGRSFTPDRPRRTTARARPHRPAAERPRDPCLRGSHPIERAGLASRSRYTMIAPASITVTPVHVADLHVEGERDAGLRAPHRPSRWSRAGRHRHDGAASPAGRHGSPSWIPLSEQDVDLAGIDIVVNTHLHGDHCGGNRLFAGKPIYVQRQELDDARSQDDYSIREWRRAARRAVRAGRRRARAASRGPTRPGTGPHPRHRRSSSSRPAGVRSSSAATSRSGSASSTSRQTEGQRLVARARPRVGLARASAGAMAQPTPPKASIPALSGLPGSGARSRVLVDLRPADTRCWCRNSEHLARSCLVIHVRSRRPFVRDQEQQSPVYAAKHARETTAVKLRSSAAPRRPRERARNACWGHPRTRWRSRRRGRSRRAHRCRGRPTLGGSLGHHPPR